MIDVCVLTIEFLFVQDWFKKVKALALSHRLATVRRSALKVVEWVFSAHGFEPARHVLVS